ncbi:MAG: preprotein translocase subunit SecY [Firmicutes bacterium]|nr:preprotein translocase subunit SecY [Bacillota bacterium]
MLKILTNAWKVRDIRKKLIFIMFILLVYRIGCHIPLPGVNLQLLDSIRHGAQANTTLFAMIAGGGFGSLFAMGIAPYITASIVMQLLTVAIPKLEQIQKEGEEGRKKIQQITRFVAVGLSLLQASATVYSYVHLQNNNGNLFTHANFLVYAVAAVAMVAGTIFIMWMGEVLTEKGIGNGSSFIIFANILSSLPQGAQSMMMLVTGGANVVVGVIKIVLALAVFACIIAFVVLVQSGERRIPVQYSKKLVGKQMYGGQSSFIPIKVNVAGVMSIIFAISLLQFPSQLAGFFPNNQTLHNISLFLGMQRFSGAALYMILIFVFTFFYTSFAINTTEMAENMKKNGGFIPGIRPGRPTSDFVKKTVDRLSFFGAFFYCMIALVPILFQRFAGVGSFGGTTLLIVTGVALEFIKQLESQLLMRHYKGFLS